MLYKEDLSFLFKVQAENTIHSGFHALISAINETKGGYILESANKLFGEKTAQFREVSTACCWNAGA